jgi:hypothetical protein
LLDAEFSKNLEPEGEIGKRGKTSEKGGDHKMPPFLGQNERQQAEGMKMSMKAAPEATISIPSPLGSA